MKSRLFTAVCALAVLFGTAAPSLASDEGALAMATDTVLIRPVCLVATAVGSVFFVASLPIAAMSRSVKSTAKALVVKPAQATFTRKLGDLDALME